MDRKQTLYLMRRKYCKKNRRGDYYSKSKLERKRGLGGSKGCFVILWISNSIRTIMGLAIFSGLRE